MRGKEAVLFFQGRFLAVASGLKVSFGVFGNQSILY
jgi:hypothetical protein